MLATQNIEDLQAKNGAVAQQAPAKLRGLDLLGVALSTACLIHCTVLPMVLALLPMFGSHFHLDEKWHWILTGLIVPVAFVALITGWSRHHRNVVLYLGGVAMVMILGAPFCHDVFGHVIEEIIATAGGLTLISAHLINHKTLRSLGKHCCCCSK